MNTPSYSAMPHEKEVLLQDGMPFDIIDVIDNYEVTDKNNQKHLITKIHLEWDEIERL